MSKGEDRSHGQAEGITRTCAVLRVRGKGSQGETDRERKQSVGGAEAKGECRRVRREAMVRRKESLEPVRF